MTLLDAATAIVAVVALLRALTILFTDLTHRKDHR